MGEDTDEEQRKRSEAAKKAAATRKKNEEEEERRQRKADGPKDGPEGYEPRVDVIPGQVGREKERSEEQNDDEAVDSD